MSKELTRRYAVYVIGLSLLFAMDRPPFLAFLLTQSAEYAQLARSMADAGLAIFGLVTCVVSSRFPRLLKAKRPFAIVGGTLSCASCIVMALYTYAGLLNPCSLPVAGLAFSAGHILLIAAWFLASRALPSKRVLPAVLSAFALSMVLVCIDCLPGTIHVIAIVLMPIVCAFLAVLTGDDDLTWGLLEHYERPTFSSAKLVDALAIALLLAEVAGAAIIRSLWAHQGIGYHTTQTAFATYLVSLCIALLCAAACLKSEYAERGSFAVSIITLPILIAASFGFLLLDDNSIAVSTVTSIGSVASAALMGMMSIVFRGTKRSYLAGAGAYGAALGATMWITYSVIPGVFRFTGSAPSYTTTPLVFIAISAIMLVLAAAFGAMLLDNARKFEEWQRQTTAKTIVIKAARSRPAESPASQTTAAPPAENESFAPADSERGLHGQLRESFNLTQREADIAELLALGYTAKRVADALTLSVSTIQSYTKSIYRKMDVHKRDELIEKVSELRVDA